MNKKLIITIFVFCVSLFLLPTMAGAATEKPWYTARLEKMGFFVFETPAKPKDFTVQTLGGKLATRSSLKGNIVLLNFWATWCPPCKEEIPSIENLSLAMKGKNFAVMAISTGETKATVSSFVADRKMSYPIYLDPKRSLVNEYASKGIPTTYILDKSGNFIAAIIGGIKYDSPEAIALFSELAFR
ncbi:MAG: TlpA disulfide reductase family protein [Rectinemataceae bacterium]|nr:TlpA disulfide reductase family protein [Rectinemataceae bacterium]